MATYTLRPPRFPHSMPGIISIVLGLIGGAGTLIMLLIGLIVVASSSENQGHTRQGAVLGLLVGLPGVFCLVGLGLAIWGLLQPGQRLFPWIGGVINGIVLGLVVIFLFIA